MSLVKNLEINKKAIRPKRKFRLVKAAVVLTLVAALSLGAYSHITEKIDQNQIQTIVEYYGEDSQENLVLDYIEIADKLDALDLEKYEADSKLYENYSTENEIMKPEEINELIIKFKAIGSSISTKNLNKVSDAVNTILSLKKQEQLVNKFIYTEGYNIAYRNVSTATKKYAGEVFGVEDFKNISFKYTAGGSSAEPSFSMTNTVKTDSSLDETQTYHFNGFFRSKVESKISEGILSMVSTDTSEDKNIEDNDEYNRVRNEFIKDALEQSAKMEQEVEDNDLYNEKLAGKLK